MDAELGQRPVGHPGADPSGHATGQDPLYAVVEAHESHLVLAPPRRGGIVGHQHDRKLRRHHPADTLFELGAAELEVVRAQNVAASKCGR